MPEAQRETELPGLPRANFVHSEILEVYDERGDSTFKVKASGNIIATERGYELLSFQPISYMRLSEEGVWVPFQPTGTVSASIQQQMRSILQRKSSEFALNALMNLARKISEDLGYSDDRRTASVERKQDAKNLAKFLIRMNDFIVSGRIRLPKRWLNRDDRLLVYAPKVVNSAKKLQGALHGMRGSYYEAAQKELNSVLAKLSEARIPMSGAD